jgi:hypothetical protein
MVATVFSLSAEFKDNAGPLPRFLREPLVKLARRENTISFPMLQEILGDWFGKVGPRLRLARNWFLQMRNRSARTFSKPF